jgi:hypothetical protein
MWNLLLNPNSACTQRRLLTSLCITSRRVIIRTAAAIREREMILHLLLIQKRQLKEEISRIALLVKRVAYSNRRPGHLDESFRRAQVRACTHIIKYRGDERYGICGENYLCVGKKAASVFFQCA